MFVSDEPTKAFPLCIMNYICYFSGKKFILKWEWNRRSTRNSISDENLLIAEKFENFTYLGHHKTLTQLVELEDSCINHFLSINLPCLIRSFARKTLMCNERSQSLQTLTPADSINVTPACCQKFQWNHVLLNLLSDRRLQKLRNLYFIPLSLTL